MKILNQFDKIYIITLEWNSERLDRLLQQLKPFAYKKQIHIIKAIPGNDLYPSSWWSEGGGAWGCMLSHVKCLQDAWTEGHEKVLILEDDCILGDNFRKDSKKFFEAVPDDWDQMYFGGHFLQEPGIEEGYLIGNNVNRTHAYAVQRKAIPQIHAHILHAPDYMSTEDNYHVDHHLGLAHERADWKVVCPDWWLCGQGENDSNINGNSHPNYFWDWRDNVDIKSIPIVLVDPDYDITEIKDKVHFGWSLLKGSDKIDKGIKRTSKNPKTMASVLPSIMEEALCMRRLPAVVIHNERQLEFLKKNYNTLKPEQNLNFFKHITQ